MDKNKMPVFNIMAAIILTTVIAILYAADCNTVLAVTKYNIPINGTAPVIDDQAGVFSDYDKISITDHANKLKESTGYQYIFLTSDTTAFSSKELDLELAYSSIRKEINAYGTVLFLLLTDGDNTDYAVQGYGCAKDVYTRAICDDIEYSLSKNADSRDYSGSLDQLLQYFQAVDNGDYVINNDETSPNNNIPVIILSLLASMIAATGIVFVLAYKNRSSYNGIDIKATTVICKEQKTYLRTVTGNYRL